MLKKIKDRKETKINQKTRRMDDQGQRKTTGEARGNDEGKEKKKIVKEKVRKKDKKAR